MQPQLSTMNMLLAGGPLLGGGGPTPGFFWEPSDVTDGWQRDNCTLSSGGIGTIMDVGVATGVAHQILSLTDIGAPPNTLIECKVNAKAGTGQYLALRGPRGDALFPWGVFDLVNGTLEGTNDIDSHTITPVGGDEYVCKIFYTTPAVIANGKVTIAIQNTGIAPVGSPGKPFDGANETIEMRDVLV